MNMPHRSAPAEDYHLRILPDIIERFGLVTGLLDHTLDRSGGGPDDSFSLEPPELAMLCRDTQTAWAALGKVDYGRKSTEQGNIKFRRSLYFVKDLPAGAVITVDAVRSVRPGFGLAPKYLEAVIGQRMRVAVRRNTPGLFKSDCGVTVSGQERYVNDKTAAIIA